MKNVKFIADIGSCHMGKKSYALEAIEIAKNTGIDMLKFQLFKGEPYVSNGNIELPYEWWGELWDHARSVGLPITSSCFDEEGFRLLLEYKPKYIKFSFSQRFETKRIERCLEEGIQPIVSSDLLSLPKIPKEATKLYCIPLYPVPYTVAFDEIFKRFDGFSDHTLGFTQTLRAVYHGALMIEKHLRLTREDVTCPDASFALSPAEFKSMIDCIKGDTH